MTKFHDDFVRIRLAVGMAIDLTLTELELDWPPPERIVVKATEGPGPTSLRAFDADVVKLDAPVYRRVSCSPMSDLERLAEPNAARMAAYIACDIEANGIPTDVTHEVDR